MARKAPPAQSPASGRQAPPKTLAANNTAPALDPRLAKVRLSSALRSDLYTVLNRTIELAAHDTYVVAYRKDLRAFVEDAVRMRMQLEISSLKTGFDPAVLLQSLPPSWLSLPSTIYIEDSSDHTGRGPRLSCEMDPIVPVPTHYARAFFIAPGATPLSMSVEGNTLRSNLLHVRFRALVARRDEAQSAFNTATRDARQAIVGSKTLGALFGDYPSLLEFVPAEWFSRLITRLTAGEAAPGTALAVSPKQVLCSLAKVRGLKIEGCS